MMEWREGKRKDITQIASINLDYSIFNVVFVGRILQEKIINLSVTSNFMYLGM
jgi:hypothetical protein